MKVAISTSSFASVDPAPLKKLEKAGIRFVVNPYGRKLNEDEIIEHLQDADGLLAGLEPLTEKVFSACRTLKAIARVGIGMDNVDLTAARAAGIKVSNTPEGPTNAVAEMTLSAALVLMRSVLVFNSAMHNKMWKKIVSSGLNNTRALVVGYGRIGRKVADLFRVMGAQILVADPLTKKNDLLNNEELVELPEGLATADIVTLHASGSDCILSDSEFDKMKNGVVVLNSARGTLIDEDALSKALDSGRVTAAWLDVFPDEPYNGQLTEYKQVLLTPHISTYTVQCRRDMEMAAVNNLLKDLGIVI